MSDKKRKKAQKLDQENFKRISSKIHENSTLSNEELFKKFNTSLDGLSETQIKKNISTYGDNSTDPNKEKPIIVQFCKAFINPFVFVLVIIAIISYFTNVVFVAPGTQSWSQINIILVLIVVGGVIQFSQEYRSGKSAKALASYIKNTCLVKRNDKDFEQIDTRKLAVGDIVKLRTGDIVPADLKILECKDLMISQSALTGESEPVQKFTINNSDSSEIGDYTNVCLLGTSVVSGTAIAVVIGTGQNTYFGAMQSSLQEADPETEFDKSVRSI